MLTIADRSAGMPMAQLTKAGFFRHLAAMVGALLCGGALACGGSTDGDGSGGSAANGGSSSQGGTSGQAGSTSCAGLGPYCTPPACGSQPLVGAECIDGQWQCPAGTIRKEDCPPDSCLSNPGFFCCDAQGGQQQPTCPNHGAAVCPDGFTKSELGQSCPKPPGCELSGCAATELCTYADHSCSSGGKCVAKPTACDTVLAPVCGCDGQIYDNQCMALLGGVDLGTECAAPSQYFACATHFCRLGFEYCEVSGGGTTESYACKPLPAACGATPTCACLSGEPCGAQCSYGGEGSIKLSCA
jgi:hypothetical protein